MDFNSLQDVMSFSPVQIQDNSTSMSNISSECLQLEDVETASFVLSPSFPVILDMHLISGDLLLYVC